MIICHVSDSHWGFEQYPAADLYVFTGDLYANYPLVDDRPEHVRQYVGFRKYYDPVNERSMQLAAAAKLADHLFENGKHGMRSFLGNPDAPILVVAGNHDFARLTPLFRGCNLVHEFENNETIELLGHRFTGHVGVPWIYGNWNHEYAEPDLMDRIREMPTVDVYLTHYPPAGVGLAEPYGMVGMLNNLMYREDQFDDQLPDRLHLFGHVHEHGGLTNRAGRFLFSNAALTYNLIEGSKDVGWRDISPL